MLFICYPRCTTCQRAQRWLGERHIAYEFRDIKEDRPGYDELKRWCAQSGLPLKRFFNTSGQAYCSMALSDKLPGMSEEEQLRLLATDECSSSARYSWATALCLWVKEAEWEAVL